MPLPGDQFNRIHSALVSTYDRAELSLALRAIDVDLDRLIGEGPGMDEQALAVLKWAERCRRVADLVRCLHEDKPTSPVLSALFADAQAWGLEARERAEAEPWWVPATILIPGGIARIGRDAGPGVPADETPAHEVQLATFALGRTPVTNRQYGEFVEGVPAQRAPGGWFNRRPPAAALDLPVTDVSWHEAIAYCAWLSQRSGRSFRLPSEAEWERAARGPQGLLYPWGNDWAEGVSNVAASAVAAAAATAAATAGAATAGAATSGATASAGSATAVDAFPGGASPEGCLDLLGNTQEWTSTLWGGDPRTCDFPYPYRGDDGREDLEARDYPDKVFRVHRGGSWLSTPDHLWSGARGCAEAGARARWRGFRVALEIGREGEAPCR